MNLREGALRAFALAKIEPDEELLGHLEKILGFVKAFEDLDLEGIEPMVSPLEGATPLRPDEPTPSLERSKVLKEAPDTQAGFIRAPSPIKET